MNFVQILNNAGALITSSLGLMAIFSPSSAAKMVGITASEPRGVSEIRATYGGLFLACGLFCLINQNQTAFTMLGFSWFGAAIVRLFSTFIDRGAANKLNFGGILLETIIAFLLMFRF